MSVDQPMQAYRRERDLTRTIRRVEAWLQRFHDHGDAGVGEVPDMLASLRRVFRRRQEDGESGA